MRPQLLHLSGPLRGRTITYDDPELFLGSAPGADVRIAHPAVAGRHAVIEFAESDCAFHLRRLEGRVFVDRREIEEVILQDGDLVELGIDGPRMRFRAYVPPGRVCKPVRRMLADARDVQRQSGSAAAAGLFARDLLTQATPRLKVGFPLAVLLLLLPLAWVAGWLGGRPSAARSADRVALAEIERLRGAQEQQAAQLAELRAANAMVGDVQRHWSRGVCLVHGRVNASWSDGRPVLDQHGQALLAEYTGSGFLAGADGQVLTNRHVVAPWEAMPPLPALLEQGAVASFASLTATFPGRQPVPVPIDGIRRRSDDLDVAVFRLPAAAVAGVPVLRLDDGAFDRRNDRRAIVVGYPTGLAALLAMADPQLLAELQAAGADMAAVIAALAAADRIRPTITQGVVGNVQERMLVYDAATTYGGSGGPVLASDGKVIAVNYAVLRGFTGANAGVPIRFGQELLAP